MAKDDGKTVNRVSIVTKGAGGSMAGYFLAMVGAAFYYVQHAVGFGEVLIALLKALVWPAFLVYQVLRYIQG